MDELKHEEPKVAVEPVVGRVSMCPRPINGADDASAAWCVLAGNCGCDHGYKLMLRTNPVYAALHSEFQEALFQRDLARTDVHEEARCSDALHKELNGAAYEVKALRRALANMVSAQHAGPITDEMHAAWENARLLLTPNASLTRGEAVALNAGLCPGPTKGD